MANNIGKLQVVLSAKIDEYKDQLQAAAKQAESFKSKVQGAMQEAGQRISALNPQLGALVGSFGAANGAAAGFGAVAAGMTAIGIATAQTAKEIANYANISGTTTAQFQEWAVGAKSVGIEQEDLADKFKDFRERVGEFTQTGSGPMKDFFEQVAPKIGVTAAQFAKLSGPDALQLYVSSLEKAGLSQEEMIWYMENMAGDLSKMLPLLSDGGKSLKEYGDYAHQVGAILSDEMIAASKEVTQELSKSQAGFSGMVNTIAGEAMPTVTKMMRLFNEATAQLQPYIKAISTGLGYAFRGIVAAGYSVIRTVLGVTGSIGSLAAAAGAFLSGNMQDAVGLAKQAGAQIVAIFDDIKKNGGAIILDVNNPQTDNPTFSKKTNNSGSNGLGAGAAKAAADKAAKDKAAADKAAQERAKTEIDKQNELIRLWGQYNGLTQAAKDQIEEYQAIAEGAGDSEINLLKLKQKYESDLQAIRDNPKLNAELKASLETRRAEVYEVEKLVETERALAEINKSNRDQQKENRQTAWGLVGRDSQGNTKEEQIKRQREILKEAADNGDITAEELAKGNFEIDKMVSGLEVLDGIASQAFGQMSDAIINYAKTGKMNFQSLAADFTAMITKMIVQALMLKAVNAAMQSAGIPISIKSANGNVFGPGAGGASLMPFANGGVFGSPVAFPMTGGKTGLMAEAGPEAIMPLKRINGKLGVMAVGAGGTSQTQVINNVSVTVNGGNTNDQTGQAVADAVIRRIARDQIYQETRHGGLLSK